MDTKELIATANASLRAAAGAALTLAPGPVDTAVDVLMADDEERHLCTLAVDMLVTLSSARVLVKFARVAVAIAHRERELGERLGEAGLRHRIRELLLG